MEENREAAVHTMKKFLVLHLAGCIAHFSSFVVVTYVRLCVEVEAKKLASDWGDDGGHSPREEAVP